MTRIDIRPAEESDLAAILALYRAVAGIPGGLLRRVHEITPDYIARNFDAARRSGLSLVAVDDGGIVGELHGHVPGVHQLRHVMGDLTVAVHPGAQGRGIGRRLFERFLGDTRRDFPQMRRVELFCRADNERAVALYRSLGFEVEGVLRGRVADDRGFYGDDLIMGLDLTAGS